MQDEKIERHNTNSQCKKWAIFLLTVLVVSCATSRSWDDLKKKYDSMDRNKAYASSSNGPAGASWNYPSIKEAIDVALKICIDGGGYDCRILEVNGKPYDGKIPEDQKPKSSPVVPKPSKRFTQVATGTGFFFGKHGLILTNAHVVNKCDYYQARYQRTTYDALLLEIDRQNDLAILKIDVPQHEIALLETTRLPRIGESVIVFGYPLSGDLSSKPKITNGILSSTAGIQDDSRFFQISAPIQPGNSGGPLLDTSGRVIGVVTSKLGDEWTMKKYGSLPQNVNFALKTRVIEAFLESSNIPIKETEQLPNQLALPDIADLADTFTVQVRCFW